MIVPLAYGRSGLDLTVPDVLADRVTVVEPRYVPGVPDEAAALRAALREPVGTPPLRDLLSPTDTVAVVFCDITRPMPSDRVLPVLLEEVETVVGHDRIVLINGTGTHRANTPDELREMLGPELVAQYRIVQHDARNEDELTRVGTTPRGTPVWINKHFLNASVRLLTGFIEPHLFAGFSGGPKMVVPAVAGLATVMANHGARFIAEPQAIWGIREGNPLWEDLRAAASMGQPTFSLNVALNKEREITAVFAGDTLASHRVGCEWVGEHAMQPVPEPFDVVVTTNSGYPLDLNVYQAIKGVSAANRVVREGGAIILAAECWDGIPSHGQYGELLESTASLDELLQKICAPGFAVPDQWQAQIQAQIQLRAAVYLYSSLDDDTVRRTHLEPCGPLSEAICRADASGGAGCHRLYLAARAADGSLPRARRRPRRVGTAVSHRWDEPDPHHPSHHPCGAGAAEKGGLTGGKYHAATRGHDQVCGRVREDARGRGTGRAGPPAADGRGATRHEHRRPRSDRRDHDPRGRRHAVVQGVSRLSGMHLRQHQRRDRPWVFPAGGAC